MGATQEKRTIRHHEVSATDRRRMKRQHPLPGAFNENSGNAF